MKKIFWIGFVLMVLISSNLTAQQRLVRLTRYEGKTITGVSASSAFDVYLVQSAQSKVVAEISEELEERLDLTLGSDGILRVSLNAGNGRQTRLRNVVLKVTVHLPELTYLKGSGAVTIYPSGSFIASRTEIQLSGASTLKLLNINTGVLKVGCGGASEGSIRAEAGELEFKTTGASEVDMYLKCGTARIDVSGASDVELTGEAGEARITVSAASDLNASGFAVKKLDVTANSAADVRVWAVDNIKASASSAATIRYRGNPAVYNTQTSSAASIRKAD